MKKSLVFITLCICLLISCTGVGYAVDTDDANDVLRFDSTGYEVKTATIYYYDEFEGPQAVKYSTDPFVEGFVDVETYTYEAYPTLKKVYQHTMKGKRKEVSDMVNEHMDGLLRSDEDENKDE